MILYACLQLLYKLSQLSLCYNISYSFIILKVSSEYFRATDSKFCNSSRTGIFQVTSNSCFRNINKKIYFRFCLCCFSIYEKSASSNAKVNKKPNQTSFFYQKHWDIVHCFVIFNETFGWQNSVKVFLLFYKAKKLNNCCQKEKG